MHIAQAHRHTDMQICIYVFSNTDHRFLQAVLEEFAHVVQSHPGFLGPLRDGGRHFHKELLPLFFCDWLKGERWGMLDRGITSYFCRLSHWTIHTLMAD